MDRSFQLEANVVDIFKRKVTPARLTVSDGFISSIEPTLSDPYPTYLIPGFVDSHVHIESSMLVPSEFAKAAVCHGTVATVSDPHEIGNVLGVEGVEFMLENAKSVPFKFCFGAPACVPATTFETSGATIRAEEVEQLLADERIGYLSEVMDFPAVLRRDADIMRKINAAKANNKIADGHAPGLRGKDATDYLAAGISTDHECYTKAEALDKIAAGCHVAIREGSAARNFEALHSLIDEFPNQTMLCSDDKHPDELIQGHINQLVQRTVAAGMDLFNALQVACVNPVALYNLPVGQLRVGDPADFIEVADLQKFSVLRTFIDGNLVAENGVSRIDTAPASPVNRFHCQPRLAREFSVEAKSNSMNVIKVLDGQLITKKMITQPSVIDCKAQADPARDILKIAVVNRYGPATPAVAFVNGFGFAEGAIASSVAHDSHNIIAVGDNDEALTTAINVIIQNNGGLSLVDNRHESPIELALPLPVAGLMSLNSADEVAAQYTQLDQRIKLMGSNLRSPFMTLSFMALLVIPEIKLSDQGLFDGNKFETLELFN
ncbi:MAG: adenine deaminase [Mariniblastus sp.]|nr:adenine deaminase [Mariniblastus sp.]